MSTPACRCEYEHPGGRRHVAIHHAKYWVSHDVSLGPIDCSSARSRFMYRMSSGSSAGRRKGSNADSDQQNTDPCHSGSAVVNAAAGSAGSENSAQARDEARDFGRVLRVGLAELGPSFAFLVARELHVHDR